MLLLLFSSLSHNLNQNVNELFELKADHCQKKRKKEREALDKCDYKSCMYVFSDDLNAVRETRELRLSCGKST